MRLAGAGAGRDLARRDRELRRGALRPRPGRPTPRWSTRACPRAGRAGCWPASSALAGAQGGQVAVTPEQVAVEGWGIDAGRRREGRGAARRQGRRRRGGRRRLQRRRPRRPPPSAARREARDLRRPDRRDPRTPARSSFAAGSADIVPESRGVIAAIADVLRGCPGAAFEIGGHTDSQGPREANQRAERGARPGGAGGAARRRTCRWCGSPPAATAPTEPVGRQRHRASAAPATAASRSR